MGLIKLTAITDDQIKAPIIPNSNNKSVFFDIAGEQLEDSTSVSCSHFRNNFTISIWFTKEAESGAILSDIAAAATVRVRINPLSATDFRITIRRTGAVVEKNYRINSFPVSTSWRNLILIVNRGASEELLIYLDGILITPTKIADEALADESSFIVDSITVGIGASSRRHYSYAVWNKAINVNEVPVIYNNGVANLNLLKNKGKYRSGKKLQHWWLYEADPNNMGKDYGRAKSENIDLMDDNTGITSADDLVLGAPI